MKIFFFLIFLLSMWFLQLDEPIWRIVGHINGIQCLLIQNGHIMCFDCIEEAVEKEQQFRCLQIQRNLTRFHLTQKLGTNIFNILISRLTKKHTTLLVSCFSKHPHTISSILCICLNIHRNWSDRF